MPGGGCWEAVLTRATPGRGAQTRFRVPGGGPRGTHGRSEVQGRAPITNTTSPILAERTLLIRGVTDAPL